MKTRLVIDGNAVYEIDEECEACRHGKKLCLEKQKQIEKLRVEKTQTEKPGAEKPRKKVPDRKTQKAGARAEKQSK